MCDEEKMIGSSGSSAQTITQVPESPIMNGEVSASTNTEAPQEPVQRKKTFHGPIAILWDIESSRVPSDARPEDVANNVRMALRVHPTIKGPVVMFSAYGDSNAFDQRLREGCHKADVKLFDAPNGRKDASDKAILVDMFLFAMDNRPPSSILVISGDVSFAPALHILSQRGYTTIVTIPSGVEVSTALINAGRFVWDWPTLARGEGFVPKNYVPGRCNLTRSLMGKPDFDERLESFRLELQELLVCYCGSIPLRSFEALYVQRYNKSPDYHSFGVGGPEELLKKIKG